MRPVLEPGRTLQVARAAYQRRDWRTAYEQLSLLREAGVDLECADVTALADCAWWLGRVTESIRLTEQVHQRRLEDGDVAAAAGGALEIGYLSILRGDLVIGSGWLSRARRLLEGQPPGLAHGLLRYVDAGAHLAEGRTEEAMAAAGDLRDLGVRLAAPTLTALSLEVEGLVQVRRGAVAAGFASLDQAMLEVLSTGVSPDWAGSIYCSTMLLCHQLADLRRARAWQRATEQWCSQFSDAVMFQGICRLHRAQLLYAEGAWADAEDAVEQVCVDLDGLNVDVVAEGEYQRGEIHRVRGDTRAARAAYQRAGDLGREPEPGWSLLLLREGRPDEAWASVNACLARSTTDPFERVRLLRAHVEIAVAHQRVDAARRSADELEDLVAVYDSPGFRTWSQHARGAVLFAQGAAEDALHPLQLACQGYQSVGATYDAARVQALLGEAFALIGERDLAEAATRSAEETMRGLGIMTRDQEAPAGLSPREVEVLRYVARGASNRDVAAALSISDKTVGRHLANVFAKIGVSSRTAAAAWAHDQGLTASFAPSHLDQDA